MTWLVLVEVRRKTQWKKCKRWPGGWGRGGSEPTSECLLNEYQSVLHVMNIWNVPCKHSSHIFLYFAVVNVLNLLAVMNVVVSPDRKKSNSYCLLLHSLLARCILLWTLHVTVCVMTQRSNITSCVETYRKPCEKLPRVLYVYHHSYLPRVITQGIGSRNRPMSAY